MAIRTPSGAGCKTLLEPRILKSNRTVFHGMNGMTCQAAGHIKLAEWLEAVDAAGGPSPEIPPLT